MEWFEIVGVLGFVLMVGAYARAQYRREFNKTFLYSFMNLMAALLIGVTYFYQWNTASFIGNTFWGLISIYGLLRWAKYRQNKA